MWFLAAAAFAQIVVQDEPNTPTVLAILMISGGGGEFRFQSPFGQPWVGR